LEKSQTAAGRAGLVEDHAVVIMCKRSDTENMTLCHQPWGRRSSVHVAFKTGHRL